MPHVTIEVRCIVPPGDRPAVDLYVPGTYGIRIRDEVPREQMADVALDVLFGSVAIECEDNFEFEIKDERGQPLTPSERRPRGDLSHLGSLDPGLPGMSEGGVAADALSQQDHALTVAKEELGELALELMTFVTALLRMQKTMSKAVRFGVHERRDLPDTNLDRIRAEWQDLLGALGHLRNHGVSLEPDAQAIAAKMAKIEQYCEYAVSLGRLHPLDVPPITTGADSPGAANAADSVVLPRSDARLVARAFLPRNPNKLRSATPEVKEAARRFLLAVYDDAMR